MAKPPIPDYWLTWSFSPSWSAILVTLLISLSLPILLHWYIYRKASAQEIPGILLVGPSGGGKTSLMLLMSNGTPANTHTSHETHTALAQLPSTTRSKEDRYRSENDTSSRNQPKFHLIDTPGHGKLRHHASTALYSRPSIRGLIFLVDSAASNLTETAEYLHDTLLLLQKRHTTSKSSKGPTSIPVLVAANKQDVFSALPTGLVGQKLEEEIGRIRVTRSKGLLDSGVAMDSDNGAGGDEEVNWLGEYGSKEFKFAQMEEHGVDVTVAGGNVKGESEGEGGKVDEWWNWIGENL